MCPDIVPDIARLGPDIGCAPISGHNVTDIVLFIPDYEPDIGTNIGVIVTRYRDASEMSRYL